MYCKKCGTQLAAESRFCTKCGNSIAQAPVHSAPATDTPEPVHPSGGSEMNEVVVWVLTAQRKESLFSRKPCSLVFMQDKLIVAHLSAQRQKEESARVSSEIKAKGKGFFKGSAAMMQHWANYHKKYYSMTSAQIFAEETTNFAVQYMNMKKLVFQCESMETDSDGRTYGHQGAVDISLLDGNKIKFSHSQSHNSTVKNMMLELFDKKLKYKK